MPSEGRFKSNKPYEKELRTSFNSSWQKYRRNYDHDDRRLKKSEPNRVLRIKCLNALHEVTTDTLYYVFATYGKVLRIVIFFKGESLNAMVEFDKIDGKIAKFIQIRSTKKCLALNLISGAITAKEYLDGFELFHNSNKLHIEFAWTSRLIVNINDNTRSWDFTRDDCQGQFYAQPLAQPQAAYFMPQPTYGSHVNQEMIEFSHVPRYEANVMMVTGLTFETSDTFKLFNLLSLCGNVAKIQFLHNFPGSAVVQMFDQMSVECCISMLNEAPVGNQSRLKIYWTDQAFQPSPFNSFLMMDGSASFTDFSESRNHRFMTPRPMVNAFSSA